MRHKFLFFITALLAMIGMLHAVTLSYSPLVPQTGDTPTVIANKAAVSQARLAAGCSYANVTTATTTVVKASAGVLERIVINTLGAGSTITLYDNASAASGTKIATLTSAIQNSITYNVAFANGLVAVTASGTAADVTFVYR
ncbi:MAG: hypothetical protein Q8Q59_15815 [Luteolibacter sp.]|nr:hypothetical protein [Luteolibacter sp.]